MQVINNYNVTEMQDKDKTSGSAHNDKVYTYDEAIDLAGILTGTDL